MRVVALQLVREMSYKAKDGFRVMGSDLHVLEPHDLYLMYMDPK